MFYLVNLCYIQQSTTTTKKTKQREKKEGNIYINIDKY